MTETGQIERQSSSYRQGLVLGLTQAEIMLLLVFCLLLAAGAMIKQKDDDLAKVRLEMAAALGTSPVNARIAELVKRDPALSQSAGPDGSVPESKIDEYWSEIIESRDIVRQLESQGLSKEAIKENKEFLSAVMELRKDGATAESLRAGKTLAEAMAGLRKELGLAPDDLKGLLAKLEEMSSKAKSLALANAELARQLDAAKGNDPEGHKWPPMISLSEAGGYYFRLGSAELSADFERRLHEEVVPTLLKRARDYDVDVIEVVGHTDELPIGARSSNLDRDMVEVLKGNKAIEALKPGDNAGLGIARSVSVVRSLLQDDRLDGLRILPLSGAQLIKTDETLANGVDVQGDVKERRRIEIRLRKSAPPETPGDRKGISAAGSP